MILLSCHTRLCMFKHTYDAFNWSVLQWFMIKCRSLKQIKYFSAVSRRSIFFFILNSHTHAHIRADMRVRYESSIHVEPDVDRNECVLSIIFISNYSEFHREEQRRPSRFPRIITSGNISRQTQCLYYFVNLLVFFNH